MANVDLTRIASNIGALNTLASLENINKQLSLHQSRLASGKRINSAADDPAGLTIATKLQARSEGMKVALSNIGDAKNLLAVTESGLGKINDIIVQMRNKIQQGASDTVGVSERNAILTQLRSYAQQVDDIVNQTEWNGNKLINGSYNTTALSFQTGASSTDTTSLNGLKDMRASNGTSSLNIAFVSTSNQGAVSNANGVLTTAGTALAQVSGIATSLYQVKVTNYGGATGYVGELMDAGGNVLLSTTNATFASDGSASTATFTNYFQVSLTAAANTLGLTTNQSTGKGVVGVTKSGDYDMTTTGVATGQYMSTASQFQTYMGYVEGKLNDVTAQLSLIGAMSGRLTFKEEQVTAAQINIESSYSRIMNANMAEEQVNASKFTILQQTATAMLAQANQAPQFLLSLFR